MSGVANPGAMTDSTTIVMGSNGVEPSVVMPVGTAASVAAAAAAAAAAAVAAASASVSGDSIDWTSSDAIDTTLPAG